MYEKCWGFLNCQIPISWIGKWWLFLQCYFILDIGMYMYIQLYQPFREFLVNRHNFILKSQDIYLIVIFLTDRSSFIFDLFNLLKYCFVILLNKLNYIMNRQTLIWIENFFLLMSNTNTKTKRCQIYRHWTFLMHMST